MKEGENTEKIALRKIENLKPTQWWLWIAVGSVVVSAIATTATAVGVWILPMLRSMMGMMM